MQKLVQASVHGRFQPLHNGHVAYIEAARKSCEFLWIGITQFNIRALADSPVAPHRKDPFNNPLTYFERAKLITETLTSYGVPLETFDIVPFPIDIPPILTDFMPNSIPVCTTVYDEWNRHKIQVLQNQGYQVHVLWEREEKAIEGHRIRKAILSRNEAWRSLVPSTTEKTIEDLRIQERLKRASESHGKT